MVPEPERSGVADEQRDEKVPERETVGQEEAAPVPEVVDGQVVPEEAGDADDFKPEPSALVAVDHEDAFRAMDRADELQILDEIQGRALEAMVYSFESGGRKLTDLSYAGVREVVRTLNARGHTAIKVTSTPPTIEEFTEDGKTYYRVLVYAEDSRTGSGQWGTAVEPKHMEKRNGDVVWDKFALTKALNKAQRNAMKALIPVEFQQTVIAQYLGDASKVRQIRAGAGAAEMAELPPPLTDPRAEAQKQRCRELFDDLKQISRLALLPAQFHAYLTRAEHSHERLDEFIAYLEQRVEEARAAEGEAA
jgi:hypothetical protein